MPSRFIIRLDIPIMQGAMILVGICYLIRLATLFGGPSGDERPDG
jgi:hypothetical protein